MPIHPTAVVAREAEIEPEADIGPYVVVDGPVRVGRGTKVMAHAYLTGWTEIGEDNTIHVGAVIGHEPQDVAYTGGRTFLRIGRRNIIREYVQIHRGTLADSATVVGDDNFFMQQAHVAHNCRIGSRTIIAGGALLAGYVEVEDGAFVSGNCVVHQFVRIGKLALLRGLSRTSRDVPPFCIMDGTHTVRGVNAVGLRRAGVGTDRIRALRRAFARLFVRKVNLAEAMRELEAEGPLSEEVAYLLAFIRSSRRGVCFGPKAEAPAEG
jgi:UDP-N-acetylglucosamine acyltransferase